MKILDDGDYQRALKKLEEMLNQAPEAEAEFQALADTVEEYERIHFPIDPPTPLEAKLFRLEQEGASSEDLEKARSEHQPE